jgi:hypothetical protein
MNKTDKTLTELNELYKSDKGITHNYLNHYEKLFSENRHKELNILEIGVLFGNSLKLWNDFFTKSIIYGVENFSQDNGHQYYSYKPVNPEDVMNDLKKYERVNLLVFDCEDVNEIEKKLSGLEFDIIIDDGSHSISQQKINYTNYSKFLKNDGIYICEDVQSNEESLEIISHIKSLSPNKNVKCEEFNVNNKSDDRIIVVI